MEHLRSKPGHAVGTSFRVLPVRAAMGAVVLMLLVTPAVVGQSTDERDSGARRRFPKHGSDIGPCAVAALRKSDVQGLKVYSPDRSRFVINKEDKDGTAQIYVGTDGRSSLDCITCEERPNGPKRKRFKMQPHWHPSNRWIFLAVERDKYSPPPLLGASRRYVEGQLQNGIFTNMYAVSPDGREWHRLTDFRSGTSGVPDGFTGPAITPDGKRAVWSQVVDGNVLAYWPFGRWELILADFEEHEGVPAFTNRRTITPKGMHWNEPGNFHPDNESLLLSGSDQKDAQGMDQYILNIRTGELKNLTNSPTTWDEHGVFSPDGNWIIYMSAYPYRNDVKASKVLSIRTEFMLMDKDGRNITQLTRFRQRGSPEYGEGIAANAEWSPDGRSASLTQLFFPKYQFWDLVFQGPCGNQR